MRFRLLLIIFIICMAGCSRVKIVYSQLDWLIPYYLETYITLTSQQRQFLDGNVKAVLEWHCREQLHDYARLLRKTNERIQAGSMTREQLVQFADRTKWYWQMIMQHMYPAVTKILFEADQEQLHGLFAELTEANNDWYEGYREMTQPELQEDYYDNMEEILEMWVGSVNDQQVQLLRAWVKAFKPLGKTGYVMRRVWQQRLQELTRNRDDRQAFNAGIKQLFVYPKQIRTLDYQQLLDHNQKVTIDLIFAVSRTMNQAQRRHFAEKVDAIASDFEDLACAEPLRQQAAGYDIKNERLSNSK